MSIDIKTLKENIVEGYVQNVPSKTVLLLLDQMNQLEKSVNTWKSVVKLVSDERDRALDALTVTQEEWLLRVKNLESMNYLLKQELEQRANNNYPF